MQFGVWCLEDSVMATTFLLGSSLAGGTSSGQSTKYLLVMHDFHARSPDELSLRKGERVELIADDSEFGDGWYSV